MAGGALTGRDEGIPDYHPERWRRAGKELAGLARPEQALEHPLYRFHQAAAMHRAYVLRELLPQHGIVLV